MCVSFFFFFKQKTAYEMRISDWSSDVCSSDLTYDFPFGLTVGGGVRYGGQMRRGTDGAPGTPEFVKSHTVWDLVASYAFSKDFDLRLNAYNLFDKEDRKSVV